MNKYEGQETIRKIIQVVRNIQLIEIERRLECVTTSH